MIVSILIAAVAPWFIANRREEGFYPHFYTFHKWMFIFIGGMLVIILLDTGDSTHLLLTNVTIAIYGLFFSEKENNAPVEAKKVSRKEKELQQKPSNSAVSKKSSLDKEESLWAAKKRKEREEKEDEDESGIWILIIIALISVPFLILYFV
ncbi:hypothetical protein N9478_10705 [Gammaproteobacteria bacterium]|nr:hypothetical protein [Gammaproteobacteria bacterium]